MSLIYPSGPQAKASQNNYYYDNQWRYICQPRPCQTSMWGMPKTSRKNTPSPTMTHRFIAKWFWESERVTFVAYPWVIWSAHVCICRGRNVCTFYVPPVVTQTRVLLNINFAKELELDKYLMLFYHLKHSRRCPLSIPYHLHFHFDFRCQNPCQHIDLSQNDSENLKELHSLHTHGSSDPHMSVYVEGEMLITYNSSQCKQTRVLLNINFAKELELDKYLMLFYHLKHSRRIYRHWLS
jgi:hypothetical protein